MKKNVENYNVVARNKHVLIEIKHVAVCYRKNQRVKIEKYCNFQNVIVVVKNRKKISSWHQISIQKRFDILHIQNEKKNRFCISIFMKQKIFRIVHDLSNHNNFHRIYDRLINFVYIRRFIKRLITYIEHCSKCQFNQIKRHFSYESFQSIITSTISFHIIIIDFIFEFSIMNDDFDCVMTITNKFIKRIMILFDKFTYTTKN